MDWLEKQLQQAHSDGVEHPDNLPYLLTPETPNGRGVLLIHGFGSSPRELQLLAEVLVWQHFTVAGIRLPGHGTSPQDLKTRNSREWLTAALNGYQALKRMDLKIGVCGLSTGALVALLLSAQQPVERLILLAPFLRLRHRLAPFAGLLSLFLPYQKRIIAEAERDFYYSQRPLKGVAQINQLLRRLPDALPKITAPTLVLTSTGDGTIAPGSANMLFRQLGSQEKFIHIYGDEVPHVLTAKENPQLDDVLKRCVDFLSSETTP